MRIIRGIMKTWDIIKKLTSMFKENNISYHFDASTSVFIHGIEFEMDDIDVVFMYKEKERVKELFMDYNMSQSQVVDEIGLEYFFAEIDTQKVHCLFYDSSKTVSKDEFNKNAETVVVDEQEIMVQSLEFYLKYSSDKKNLKPRIEEYLAY